MTNLIYTSFYAVIISDLLSHVSLDFKDTFGKIYGDRRLREICGK